jgi:hypothetical protein
MFHDISANAATMTHCESPDARLRGTLASNALEGPCAFAHDGEKKCGQREQVDDVAQLINGGAGQQRGHRDRRLQVRTWWPVQARLSLRTDEAPIMRASMTFS